MYSQKNDKAEIGELRQVNNIQQEQLLQLAKKANALQSDMEKLNELELEIRQMSTADGCSGNPGAGGTHDGQGGPRIQPDIQNVTEALDNLEKNMAARKQSQCGPLHQRAAVGPEIGPAQRIGRRGQQQLHRVVIGIAAHPP